MKSFRAYLYSAVMVISTISILFLNSCKDDEVVNIHNPLTAEEVSVDRFSTAAGHLMVRNASNGLPAANTAINFDQEPFITKGKGPNGQIVEYYNFDTQSIIPAPIYVIFREGETTPVTDQLNIIDVLPGEQNYNDFWQVFKVTVPASYKANEVASYSEILDRGYKVEATTSLVNCPVVPEGSTATKRAGGSAALTTGWYKTKIVYYFSFDEKALATTGGHVPTSPIYVCFTINPADNGGGPDSGFKVEPGTRQTHNVVATVPSDANYSPLWVVSAFDNTEFNNVTNLTTAQMATSVGNAIAIVNCPIVSIQ